MVFNAKFHHFSSNRDRDSLKKEEAETGVWHQRSSFYLLFSVIFGENEKLPQWEEDVSPQTSLLIKENIEATFNTQICDNDCVTKVRRLKAFWFVLESRDDAAPSPVKKTSWSCVRSLMSLESTTGADVMGHEKLISLCVNEGGRFWFIPNLHTQFTFQKEAILLISMKLGVCYGLTWKHGIHESVQKDSGSEDITHGK